MLPVRIISEHVKLVGFNDSDDIILYEIVNQEVGVTCQDASEIVSVGFTKSKTQFDKPNHIVDHKAFRLLSV